MRLLLDTNVLLWHIAGSSRMSEHVRDVIAAPDAELFVSMASLWEIAIKVGLGKLTLSAPFSELHQKFLPERGFQLLLITPAHLDYLLTLSLHHRDPFDRIIVAQALSENLTLVSSDEGLDAYGIRRIW
jgi:PIN domain nuclease of toxin-antitoxin system